MTRIVDEALRMSFVAENSAAVQSDDPAAERARLSAIHGAENVWDTRELQEKFSVEGFMAPFVTVTRKSDGAKGAVEFQHYPRLYFTFTPTS